MIEIYINNKEINRPIYNMIENNRIKYILLARLDKDRMIIDNGDLVSLRDKYKKSISYKEIKTIFEKLYEAIVYLKDFMIYEEDIYFSLDYIFTDESSNLYFIANLTGYPSYSVASFFNDIIKTCMIEIDGEAKKIIEMSNYLNYNNYRLEDLCKEYFKKELKKEMNYGKIKEAPDNREQDGSKNKMKSKSSIFQTFISIFKKKPYKVKNLDIDFKLPYKKE
ncbi:MAG: DUF6382 domain-containing protein [Tissierellia bacterium]|nr:DUF6382 domain-containing protein [Tissierellia bacterium]